MSEETDDTFGQSWWGKEWIESLDRLSTAWQNRLPRGRDYAAKGHVISLDVDMGKITAKVQGSRSKPYHTTIEVPTIKEDEWKSLVEVLSTKSRYPAQLLNGEMPEGIGELFDDINLNLFPARSSELLSSCSCPDKAKPCKHIVAVHYAFGQAMDQDPFLLFLLRGADRDYLLKQFRHAWFGNDVDHNLDENWSLTGGTQTGIQILPRSADRFNRSPEGEELELRVYVQRPEQSLLILDRLGNPPSWELPIGIEQLLGPVIEETGMMAFEFATDQGLSEAYGEHGELIPEGERQSPYDSFLDAFSVPDVVKEAAQNVEERDSLSLPKSLPAADMLTGAIGVDTKATEKNKERDLKAKKKKKTQGGAVLIRKGGNGKKSGRRKVVTPKKRTPADKESSQASNSSDKKQRRKIVANGGSGPVVRRRGRRIVAGADDKESRKERKKKVVSFDAAAQRAWNDENAGESFNQVLQAWQIEPSEPRYMLLAATREQVDNSDEKLQKECERIAERAKTRGRRITSAELLLLLTLGEVDTATDLVVDMDEEVWMERDGVGSVYLPFALMAIVAERDVPDDSCLTKLWDHLFDRGEEHFNHFEIEPAPIGAWLEWALGDYPITADTEERLLEVVRNLTIGLIEAAREDDVAHNSEEVACYVVAVAECLRLVADESLCDQFVAIANARSAADPRIGRALQKAIRESSLMSYRGDTQASGNG